MLVHAKKKKPVQESKSKNIPQIKESNHRPPEKFWAEFRTPHLSCKAIIWFILSYLNQPLILVSSSLICWTKTSHSHQIYQCMISTESIEIPVWFSTHKLICFLLSKTVTSLLSFIRQCKCRDGVYITINMRVCLWLSCRKSEKFSDGKAKDPVKPNRSHSSLCEPISTNVENKLMCVRSSVSESLFTSTGKNNCFVLSKHVRSFDFGMFVSSQEFLHL